MSPTIAMRQPSSDGPRWRRSVNASSSAWVGCSWRPSPALTTDASIHSRDAVRRAGGAVPHDHRVDAHRLDRLDRVEQALALLHRRRADRERHRVGGQPLRRGLERQPGAGRVLVEERHDGLAPQGRAPSGSRGPARRGRRPTGRASPRWPAGRDPRSRAGASCADPRVASVGCPQLDRVLVHVVGLARAGPARPRPRRSAGSCPRSRPGSAARGGRGRRAPRAGSPAGRPSSVTASSAARIVRPVNSTSSTSTTTRPVTSTGTSVGPSGCTGRSPMSSR